MAMTSLVKRWLRAWVPPAIVEILRRPAHPTVSYGAEYATWDSALADAGGYDDAAILDKVKNATLRVIRGESAYERDSVVFDRIEISWPVLAGLLWAATRNHGSLRVLDFGGSLGTTYRQNKAYFDDLAEVLWGVVEQPHYVACGRQLESDHKLRFFETIDDCAAEIRPNAVMLGAVLQYLPDPYGVLERLSRTNARVMIVDRTPFSAVVDDRITVQVVPPSIYRASYPSWVFSMDAFRKRVPSEWRIVSVFDSADASTVTASGLPVHFQGLLLTR